MYDGPYLWVANCGSIALNRKKEMIMLSNEVLLEKFIENLQLKNMSPHTITAYTKDINGFFKFCVERDLLLQDVEAPDLRSFIGHRISVENLVSSSVKRQIASIRQFMQWATFNKHLEGDNSQDVRIKTRSQYLPQVMEIDMIIRLLDQPEPSDPTQLQLWKRDKAFMELFYSTGMRLNELHTLNVGALDHSSLLVRVTGKGNKQRIIPFGRKASEAVKEWMGVYSTWVEDAPNHNSPLFVSLRGTRLSYPQIAKRITVQAKRAGIESHIHPHLFRHSFATHMLSNAGDIRSVQEMLGHVSLSTTQIYTHLDFDALASSYDKAHPRASKSNK